MANPSINANGVALKKPELPIEKKEETGKDAPALSIDQVKQMFAQMFAAQVKPSDDTRERMSDLIQKVAEAKAAGEEWVETSPENIRLLQPKGLNGKKYFCWQGIKICEPGKIDEIEAEESQTAHDRMHPESKTVVLSGLT